MKFFNILLSCALFLAFETVNANISNGTFETGFLTHWKTIYGSNVLVTNPGATYGSIQGSYVASVGSSGDGTPSDATIEATMGWSSGRLDQLGNREVVSGSVLYRIIQVKPGDKLTFKWSFVNQTSLPGGNDFAFFAVGDDMVILADNTSSFVPVDTWTVQTAWQQYTHIFEQGGIYKIAYGCVDVDEPIYGTSLLVDDVQVVGETGTGSVAVGLTLPSQVPDPNPVAGGGDSDGDGVSDAFESAFGLNTSGKNIYRRIEIASSNWAPKIDASNSGQPFTSYTGEYAVPGLSFNNVQAGDELVIHLVFTDPLVFSSSIPDDFYLGVSSLLPGSTQGTPGTTLEVTTVGGFEMKPMSVTVGTNGPTALYAITRQNDVMSQGKTIFQAVLVIKVGPSWNTGDLPIGKVFFQSNRSEFKPNATYADFPVKAIPLTFSPPEMNAKSGPAMFLAFDAPVGFNYDVQASDSPGFETYTVIETIPGNNERIEKYFALETGKQFFRVVARSIFQ